MHENGYVIRQAGSIIDSDGFIYTAYLFSNRERWLEFLDDPFILAFYRWDGKENVLIGTAYPSWYTKHEPIFPRYYALANWDDPYNSMLGLSVVENPDEQTRQLLHLQGYSSDINQNGRPEFIFGAEYCPASCSRPTYGFDYFEIRNSRQVVNLAEGLPGRIDLYPTVEDPLTFEADDAIWYGFFTQIFLPYFYVWDGQKFADVTQQHQAEILSRIDALLAEVESSYGQAFEREDLESGVYQILLWHQLLGMRRKGLDLFLEITDIPNWPSSDLNQICWLELSRARAVEDYSKQLEFSIVPSSYYLAGALGDYPGLSNLLESFDETTYELSACYELVSKP
jgi:hypothetical protein